MAMEKKIVFITGVPGSRWGRLEYILRNETSNIIDNSCWMPHLQDTPSNGTEHYHRFFGPYHQYGERFDQLALMGRDAILQEIDRAFDGDGIRFVRCHWFAYQLDWIKENLPEVDILMMMREPQMSLNWWLESGGWGIQYPQYHWYGNTSNMRRQIFIENECMEKFIKENNLQMNYNVWDMPDWIDENWPEWKDYLPKNKTYHHKLRKEEDKTLWPVLYRGINSITHI